VNVSIRPPVVGPIERGAGVVDDLTAHIDRQGRAALDEGHEPSMRSIARSVDHPGDAHAISRQQ
jgi:hypothetical protein